MKKTTKIRVNLVKLIEMFDEHNNLYKGHTTPIIGLIGEDLNAAIFSDFLVRRKKAKNVGVLSYSVNTGQKRVRGRELDRWIKEDNILYQAEIKSWCSFQIGGYELLLGASKQDTKELANKKWEKELSGQYNNIKDIKELGKGKVSKVLVRMKIPDDLIERYKVAEPLVIHWMPISNKEAKPFFSYPVKDLGMNKKFTKRILKDFKKVNYFSCSLYIRELINEDEKELNLSLPNVDVRMDIIKKLMK
jgi:hypothetical protein